MIVNDFHKFFERLPKAAPMFPIRFSAALLLVLLLVASAPAQAGPPKQVPPDNPQPIFTVDQVKVGMKGYGMTVFHGTEIEPFNVEVVTINANETPNQSVIWVRCTDERMIKTGPVQGMSGSPIYLWEDGEKQEIGKGGRLIGAFAFGYGNTNECVVGVQPIQYMRAVGARATAADRPKLSMAAPAGSGYALMSRLVDGSENAKVSPLAKARATAVRDLYKVITPENLQTQFANDAKALASGQPGAGQVGQMMVPMSVGSAAVAEVLSPVLMPMGIQPFAVDPSAVGGKPPKGFDVKDVKLEPGSALVVPFAWGDADLSGAGTVTDVLPDGTVLGFGHAMDGIGVTAIPMATGYVHFIVSLNTISYKRSGTLQFKGALVQDEQTAVADTSATPYTSAPVQVEINIEGQPKYTYHYEVLNHPKMTPAIAAAVVAQSATSVQGPPMYNTARYNTTVKFSSGHEMNFKSASVGVGAQTAAVDIATVVGALTQNSFQQVSLESVRTTIDIDYGLDLYQLFSAKLDKTTAAPGETVNVTLELMGMHEKIKTKTLTLTIPEDMPDGDTQIMLADAATYTQMMLATQPALSQIDSVDDLAKGLTQVVSAQPTSAYTMLQTPRVNLALDGQALEDLPTSRAVVLATNNPRAQLYKAFESTEHDMGRVFMGQAQIPIKIKRDQGTR